MSDAHAVGERSEPEVRRLDIGPAEIEVVIRGSGGSGGFGELGLPSRQAGPVIGAAHPADAFGAPALNLLAEASGARVVVVNPRGLGSSIAKHPSPDDSSLETMVDDLEAARRALGLDPWIFWGMSGGGFLGLVYAHRYPEALAGLILESACACFRERLQDPACIASPFHPMWQEKLVAAGFPGGGVEDRSAIGSDGEWIDLEGGASALVAGGAVRMVSPVPPSPAMRRAMPAMLAYDARPWLGEIRVPTLILCGDSDPFLPLAHARAVHEGIAGSEFVPIVGAGHVPVVARHPEVDSAVRRFLGALPAPA